VSFKAAQKQGRAAAGQDDGGTRRRATGLLGVCLGTALIIMEANVVNVAVCSLAGQVALLIPARALQGAGAALLAPAPLTLITRMYTDPAGRARAVAAWVTVGGIGFTIGPLLSGLLLDTLG
jgi:DHA2 family methylenomycin A resistance protein-like MFS transporter